MEYPGRGLGRLERRTHLCEARNRHSVAAQEIQSALDSAFSARQTGQTDSFRRGQRAYPNHVSDESDLGLSSAYELKPDNAKYGYTLAFYLRQHGDMASAVDVLEDVCAGPIDDPNAYVLLADIHASQGNTEAAKDVYRKASQNDALPEQTRRAFGERLQASGGK